MNKQKPFELPEPLQRAIHKALEKDAQELVVFYVENACVYTRYIVICHGHVEAHVKAIAEHILETVGPDLPLHHVEGLRYLRWVILDYFDVIFHIFRKDVREYYEIETMWANVPVIHYTSSKSEPS